jgi:glyoxylase-like metal-dependent hydrolase (beta-lactamase superfamily II)
MATVVEPPPRRRGRRRWLWLSLVVVALVGALFWLGSGLPTAGEPRIVVNESVVGVLAGSAYAWVLHAGEHVVLVDSGSDRDAAALLAELERQGVAPTAVAAILLTHAHGDHIAGISAFANATVYCGDGDRPLLGGYKLPRALLPRLAAAIAKRFHGKPPLPARVEVVLPGSILRFGGLELEAIAVPGHTMGGMAYRFGDVLFTGDSLVASGDGVAPLPRLFNDRTSLLEASLPRLAAAAWTVIADGHAGLSRDGRTRFAAWLDDES